MRYVCVVIMLIICTIVFIADFCFAQIQFKKHIIENNFDQAAGVYSCDVDSDGNIDVLGAAGNDGIAWWRNEGGNPVSWTKQVIDNSFGSFSVYGFDVDQDGNMDIIGAAWYNAEIAWWKNNGGNPTNWTKQVVDANFTDAHDVFVCDFDDDGDGDIFGASAGLNDITWWRNDGGNPIQWIEQIIDGSFPGARSVWVADLDGDDDKDVCGAALTSNEVTWWRNDGGDPILWKEFRITNNFRGSHQVYPCDMDKDGDQDILGAAYSVNEVSWWRNDGGDPINWTKQVIDNQFGGSLTTYATDFDLDGDMDVLGGANISDDVSWWRNDGGDPFIWTRFDIDNKFNGAWVIWADDFDGDGDIDALGAADTDDDIAWFENDLIGAHFSVDVTSGHAPLIVQFNESSVTFPSPLSYAWDFENDGTINTREQNPTWTFIQPGVYSVKLEVTNDSTSYILLKEKFIHVFNGASALLFNGENSKVFCQASPDLNLKESVTIEAWIKPVGWGSLQNIGFGRIVDKTHIALFLNGNGGSLKSYSLAAWLSTDSSSPGFIGTPENTINLNKWQHVAITYDAISSTSKLFINGLEQTLTQVAGQASGNIKDNFDVDLIIGNSSNNMAYEGIIDEVRVWNIARSSEDIKTVMNHTLSGDEYGLVAYWQMDEGNGSFMTDGSGNQNDCFNENTLWIQGFNLETATEIENGSDVSPDKPNNFMLFHSYPNPFNSTTTIKYNISKASILQLKIYDINGRLVKTLINSGTQAAGLHQTKWNGRGMFNELVGSGNYFCRLIAPDFTKTINLLFLK